MAKFSETSLSRLATVHPELRRVMFEVIRFADIHIVYGWRDEIEQNRAYELNMSSKRWPYGKHNHMQEVQGTKIPCSLAVDFAPWFFEPPHIRWKDVEGFIYCAGIIMGVANMMNVPLRWGGDWNRNLDVHDQKFFDWGHVELLDNIT